MRATEAVIQPKASPDNSQRRGFLQAMGDLAATAIQPPSATAATAPSCVRPLGKLCITRRAG